MALSGTKTAKFIELMATGCSVSETAKKLKIPRRTAFRLAKEKEIVKEIEAFRSRLLNAASGKLAKSTTFAADELGKLIRDKDARLRLTAIRLLFDQYLKISEREIIEKRLEELESRMTQNDEQKSY